MNERSLLVVAAKEWDAHRDAKHVDLDPYLLEVQDVEQLSAVGRKENVWPIHDQC